MQANTCAKASKHEQHAIICKLTQANASKYKRIQAKYDECAEFLQNTSKCKQIQAKASKYTLI